MYHEAIFIQGEAFTLEKIIELGLDQYYDQISETSAAASNELSIEQVTLEKVHSLFAIVERNFEKNLIQ